MIQIKIQFGPSRFFLHLLLYFTFPTVTISSIPQNTDLLCAFECASFSLFCGGHSIFSLITILQTTILMPCIWFNSDISVLVVSLCVFASLLFWLTGMLRFGEDSAQRSTVRSIDVMAKWGCIIFTNPVCSQKVLQAHRVNWYHWGWSCSSYLRWMLLKSKGYLRFLSTVCVGKFNIEIFREILGIRNHCENSVQHLHGCDIQLCGAQKPLRLYPHPEQEAYLAVSFRISCRVYFLPFWDMGDCWKSSGWLFPHKISVIFLISGSPVGMGIAHRFFFSWEPGGAGRKQY